MGAKESRHSCINYEEALRRVSETEICRLRQAFRRSAGVGRTHLSRNSFQQDVLTEAVPNDVTDLLYTACGGTTKGISFKDLLCGLVLITKGTDDEKIKFLWNLYSIDNYIYKYNFKVELDPSYSEILFGQSDRVNYEQFSSALMKIRNATILTQWLLSNQSVALTSDLESANFYQTLAGVTHLDEKDISDLEKEFWRLKNLSPNSQLDLQLLRLLLSPPLPNQALQGLFNAFDENRDGHIDFKELCCGVSAACRGPEVERTRFCFKIFDVDRDGILNSNEILQMINVLLLVAKESHDVTWHKDTNKDEIFNEIINFTLQSSHKQPSSNVGENQEQRAVHEDGGKCIFTVEDFMMWNVESRLKLLQPFLDLLFQICHIVFGLWPECRHMEYNIVHGWLEREVKRKYQVGQYWHLIAYDWWLHWLHFTSDISTTCSACHHTINGSQSKGSSALVDEAVMCDESFNSNSLDYAGDNTPVNDNSSLASANSSISVGRKCNLRPGAIDNTKLVVVNTHKNIPSLTGEGGNLRKDIPLVHKRDFELVPKSLWKALNRWYGDKIPLPRQVIQTHNSTNTELELYPLNLGIMFIQNAVGSDLLNANWSIASGAYATLSMASNTTIQSHKRVLAYTSTFSCLATVQQVIEFLCQHLHLTIDNVRLWLIPSNSMDQSASLLDEENMTLGDLMIKDNDQLLLEIRNDDQTWPEELNTLTIAANGIGSSNERRLTRNSIMSIHVPGTTGLHNLGNTCFMNAAFQVLFNTRPLTQYFHQSMHLYELNTTNKLGTRGQLAIRYAELLNEVWTVTSRSVAPVKLRFCITKFAPQFAGGGQHDSQELLEWFLDALHEDLNRVTERPYSELRDSNGRPDNIVAIEAWNQHNNRNQSIIIDLFYGQLKSKVICLCCGHESVRFDPFSLLSLPLPMENYTYLEVIVILLNGSVPTKYGIRLNSDSNFRVVKQQISSLCALNVDNMLICELSNSQIKRVYGDQEKLQPITLKELYVYELPPEQILLRHTNNCCTEDHKNRILLPSEQNNDPTSINYISDNYKNIDKHNAQVGKTTFRNEMNGENCTNGYSWSLEDVTKEYNCKSMEMTVRQEPQLNQEQNANSNNNNNNCKMTAFSISDVFDYNDDDIYEDDMRISRKRTGSSNCSTDNTLVSNALHTKTQASRLLNSDPTLHTYGSSGYNSFELSNGETTSSNNSTTDSLPLDNNNGTVLRVDAGASSPAQCNLGKNFKTNDIKFKYGNTSSSTIFSRVHAQYGKVGKYLMVIHRQVTRQDSYFLSHRKIRHSVFGLPLIIPIIEGGTHKDLYKAVWIQVNRLLSPLPAATDQANHATDCDDSLGYDFPFTLKVVKQNGLMCAVCSWINFCSGCVIQCNDEPLLQDSCYNDNASRIMSSTLNVTHDAKTLDKNNYKMLYNVECCSNKHSAKIPKENEPLGPLSQFFIAIDWDPTALHLRYQSSLEKAWKVHESVIKNRKEQTEPVDLDHCLQSFTSEEKLEQCYYCSHCKAKKPATKKLQIWKLPPILIVHLKRFNCVNNKWVKSQKAVHFPFENFDPTPYLASIPQETILRHRELRESKNIRSTSQNVKKTVPLNGKTKHTLNNMEKTDDDDNIFDVTDSSNNGNQLKRHENHRNQLGKQIIINPLDNDEMYTNSPRKMPVQHAPLIYDEINCNNIDTNNHENNINNSETTKYRQRLISTSLDKSPIIDNEFEDFHEHKLKPNEDRFDPKYNLYAVVSHTGLLSGGHYVAYAANPNGNWYCYNDSSCRDLSSSKPNIDKSSAYLLFYERQGLDYQPYLPAINSISDKSDGSNSTASSTNNTNATAAALAAAAAIDLMNNDAEMKRSCSIC